MLNKRSVGPVTGASASGGGLGAALSEILVHSFPSWQGIETPITVVLTVGLALIGGYLIPPKDRDLWNEVLNLNEELMFQGGDDFIDDEEDDVDEVQESEDPDSD